MKFDKYIRPGVSSLMKFDNFFNSQPEIEFLKNEFYAYNTKFCAVYVYGESGNGISHLLNAVCNEFIRNGKRVALISTRWLRIFLKENKSLYQITDFQKSLLIYDLIAIDNLEELRISSVRLNRFISDLVNNACECKKRVILGCSNGNKISLKHISTDKEFFRIKLKKINAEATLNLLNYLSEYDLKISKEIVRNIARYNGTIQEYINCLISIRYNDNLSEGRDDLRLNNLDYAVLRKYFNGPQLRKCFLKDNEDFFSPKDFRIRKINFQ